ncbi:MAG: phosphotransferase [Proteobacteria bacterium]|nr:phosphotransferase [Pseudomonadota bacterium]
MKKIEEPLPSDAILAHCCETWELSDLVFVRKMENIVYACQRHGQKVFLRFTTPLRRTIPQIQAELDFITHLAQAHLRVPHIIPTRHDQQIISLQEGKQTYATVLFHCVDGEHPSIEQTQSPTFLKELGRLIAIMHQVSQKFEPISTREHWDKERGIRHALEAASQTQQKQMRLMLNDVMQWIYSLDKTTETYSLIHADLNANNLYVKQAMPIGIIDFDDACYHFHIFDLAIVIYAMANRLGHLSHNELEQTWLAHLVDGYRSIQPLSSQVIAQIPQFINFACLRLYFWLEYHQLLDTFHKDALERVCTLKIWAFNRINGHLNP